MIPSYKSVFPPLTVDTMLFRVGLVAFLAISLPLVSESSPLLRALVPRESLTRQDDKRIVGGQNAAITDFPYQLSLRVCTQHICGASVISKNYAVSAAHCVYGRGTFAEKLVGGSAKLWDVAHATRYSVTQNNVHPNFNPDTIDYDVSVLRVWPRFFFSNRLQPLQLPQANTPVPVNTTAVVSGWGVVAENAQVVSKSLQSVQVQIQNTTTCNSSYEGAITDRMICASSPDKDACQGDSGGPLVLRQGNSVITLIGIVSFGVGCAETAFPGVYTNVSNPEIRSYITSISGV